ncbi:MAG: transposase [Geminicoccaceae bacterium]
MSEDGRAVMHEVSRTCLPAVGAKAKDDRLLLEALHFFALHSIPWRALPERFGKSNAMWKRFGRLAKAGIFGGLSAILTRSSETAHLVQLFDSTAACAHFSAVRKAHQAPDRSRGGFSMKVHSKTDLDGLPDTFERAVGDATFGPMFEILRDAGSDHTPRAVVDKKGHDRYANREPLRA